MPYGLSPDTASGMVIACRIARRRIACDQARRVRYRPSPDTASGMGVACPIARCRIVCGMARRRITSRRVPARVGTLDVPAVVTVRRAEHPSSAMPRPNSACSRRRHRRFTNVYSFTWPSRFIMSPSAARLRRGVGPLIMAVLIQDKDLSTMKWARNRKQRRQPFGTNTYRGV